MGGWYRSSRDRPLIPSEEAPAAQTEGTGPVDGTCRQDALAATR